MVARSVPVPCFINSAFRNRFAFDKTIHACRPMLVQSSLSFSMPLIKAWGSICRRQTFSRKSAGVVGRDRRAVDCDD